MKLPIKMPSDPLEKAKSYPFDTPAMAYLFERGQARPLDDAGLLDGRIAVVASGSNASPGRLREKFGEAGAPIPVTPADLHGYEAVYSAHFAAYGSIPATLAPTAGGVAEVSVTWLTEAQAETMHGTEAIGVNYGFYRLDGLRLAPALGPEQSTAYAYVSLPGALQLDGDQVALAERAQAAVLTQARDLLAPDMALDDFIREIIEDDDMRRFRKQQLRRHGRPIELPGGSRIL